jgi:hypothetical protein
VLLIKDVDTEPAWKRWFTRTLDFAMSPTSPVHYWSAGHLGELLERSGFTVRQQSLADSLPYPHVLFIARREARRGA